MGPLATADPTMQLIASLDDPARFVRKDRVAVFKPHRRTFANGQVVEVTDEDLDEIAQNVNDSCGADGQLVKLTIGHRQQTPGFPETNQPPVVGYAKDYRAEWVQRPDGPALRLTHTEYVRRNSPYAASVLAGNYPERSPEYDPDNKVITGVALLTRDQALSLGTVCYQATPSKVRAVTPTNPHAKPAGHEKVVAYMQARPGVQYEEAVRRLNLYQAPPLTGDVQYDAYQLRLRLYELEKRSDLTPADREAISAMHGELIVSEAESRRRIF